MNRPQKCSPLTIRNSAWRRAVEQLDDRLDQNSEHSYGEKLDLIGRHMFGDLWRKQNQNQNSKLNT